MRAVEPAHLDAVPERAERQPRHGRRASKTTSGSMALKSSVGARPHHHAAVDPAVVGAVRVERPVGGQADDGVVGAERRGRVVQVVLAVEVRDVRRPEVAPASCRVPATTQAGGVANTGPSSSQCSRSVDRLIGRYVRVTDVAGDDAVVVPALLDHRRVVGDRVRRDPATADGYRRTRCRCRSHRPRGGGEQRHHRRHPDSTPAAQTSTTPGGHGALPPPDHCATVLADIYRCQPPSRHPTPGSRPASRR